MSREIKFRYRIQLQEEIVTREISLDQLQHQTTDLSRAKVLSRDEYTGLTDKNGKEIYEGDIVESSWYGKTYRDEVKYDYYSDSDGEFRFDSGIGFLVPSECEIIGNVHENPKLFKD